MRPLTPFQTIGPFFHDALLHPGSADIAEPAATGRRIEIHGRVRDGAGAVVTDAMLEIWQADPSGRYSIETPGFHGFGRIGTDASGEFHVSTLAPGRTPGPDGTTQAPHLLVQLFARGILSRLVTRIYFEDEPLNEQDPILSCVPRERRKTLLAHPSSPTSYRFDIVLQGEDETVFFDV